MAIQINHDHQEKIEFLKISAKFFVTVMYMIPRPSFFIINQFVKQSVSMTVVNQHRQSLKLGY